MKYNISPWRSYACLLLSVCFTTYVHAQGEKRAIKGEMATCQVEVVQPAVQKGKAAAVNIYKPLLNQVGYFDRITNIQPLQKVSIQTVYPQARAGEKIAIVVLDGGTLDNDLKHKIVQLDKDRKISFGFQAARDPGIYRIVLKKGYDTKVVQIWVGPEPMPVKR